METLVRAVINMMIAVVAGFAGAFVGAVPLMWLVALVNQHVLAAVRPAGYWDLFLISWILGYMTCGFLLSMREILEGKS